MRIGVDKVTKTIDYHNQINHKYELTGLDNE